MTAQAEPKTTTYVLEITSDSGRLDLSIEEFIEKTVLPAITILKNPEEILVVKYVKSQEKIVLVELKTIDTP